MNLFILTRAIAYAALFIGLVLIYVPARLLAWSGIGYPASLGAQQIAGMAIGTAGGLVAIWSIFTFVSIGQGTPAPFDPPRRLVVRGPYKFVRNPMYLGAGLTLSGAALFYGSLPILAYAVLFFLIVHTFVVLYEEPTLRRTFRQAYKAYCNQVRRWWPGRGVVG